VPTVAATDPATTAATTTSPVATTIVAGATLPPTGSDLRVAVAAACLGVTLGAAMIAFSRPRRS